MSSSIHLDAKDYSASGVLCFGMAAAHLKKACEMDSCLMGLAHFCLGVLELLLVLGWLIAFIECLAAPSASEPTIEEALERHNTLIRQGLDLLMEPCAKVISMGWDTIKSFTNTDSRVRAQHYGPVISGESPKANLLEKIRDHFRGPGALTRVPIIMSVCNQALRSSEWLICHVIHTPENPRSTMLFLFKREGDPNSPAGRTCIVLHETSTEVTPAITGDVSGLTQLKHPHLPDAVVSTVNRDFALNLANWEIQIPHP